MYIYIYTKFHWFFVCALKEKNTINKDNTEKCGTLISTVVLINWYNSTKKAHD